VTARILAFGSMKRSLAILVLAVTLPSGAAGLAISGDVGRTCFTESAAAPEGSLAGRSVLRWPPGTECRYITPDGRQSHRSFDRTSEAVQLAVGLLGWLVLIVGLRLWRYAGQATLSSLVALGALGVLGSLVLITGTFDTSVSAVFAALSILVVTGWLFRRLVAASALVGVLGACVLGWLLDVVVLGWLSGPLLAGAACFAAMLMVRDSGDHGGRPAWLGRVG
jgi:hypothetical protein